MPISKFSAAESEPRKARRPRSGDPPGQVAVTEVAGRHGDRRVVRS